MSFNATTSKFSDYVRGLPAASEADLAAGNNMPLVRSGDVKKLPAEVVAKDSSIAPLFSNSVSYKENDFVFFNGYLYRFTADHPAGSWIGTDATVTYSYVFREIERAKVKSSFLFFITNDGILSYDGNYGENNDNVYFTFSKNIGVRGSSFGSTRDKSLTISQLATELGVSLETSPCGLSNCIKLQPSYCVVYDFHSYTFKIKSASLVREYDVRILENRTGRLVGGELLCLQTRQLIAQDKSTSVYIGGTMPPYIEQPRKSSSSIYFTAEQIILRGVNDRTITMSDLASELSVGLVDSLLGIPNCIAIPNQKVLCVTTIGKFSLKDRKSLAENDVKIISNINGCVVNSFYDYFQAFENERIEAEVPFYSSCANKDFALNIRNCEGIADTLVFFTDPHCMGVNNAFTLANHNGFVKLFGKLREFTRSNNVGLVVCGGDVITEGDSQQTAVSKLGYFVKQLKSFGCDAIMVNGNHDMNYLGKLDEASSSGTGLLSRTQSANSFGCEKLYFKKASLVTNYFVLDTGLNTTETLSSYRYEQLKWLAEGLALSDKHSVVVMHIYSNASNPTDWTTRITTFASKVQQICSACNSRGGASIDGETFSFANATNNVACILCGHTHYDYVDSNGDVPVIAVRNALNGNDIAFDAMVIDYANGKLHLSRIGQGSNRSVDIIQ